MAVVKIIPNKKTPKDNLKYITDPEKTLDGELIFAHNTVTNYKFAGIDMENTRERWGISKKVQLHHMVHSFSTKDNDKITIDIIKDINKRWCKEMFGDNYQYVAAIHIPRPDKNQNYHIHISCNNVTVGGDSVLFSKAWCRKARMVSNKLCREYGLVNSITNERPQRRQKSHYKEDMESKKGNSWKDKLAKDIDNLMFRVNSMDQFFSSLNALGYEVKQGKYNMLVKPSKGRYMNFYKLGAGYSLQNIEATINYTKNHPKTKYQLKQRGLITLEAIHILNHNQNKLQDLREEYNQLIKSTDPLDKERSKQISKEIKDIQKAFIYLKDIDKTIEQRSLEQLEIEARSKSDKITYKEKEIER